MVQKGLKKNEVKIVPFQNSWTESFRSEKVKIDSRSMVNIKGIEHIGSTSIHGMSAKPIIDILIGIDKYSNFKKLIHSLKKLEYVFHSEPRRGQAFFFKRDKFDIATHHLKVVRYKGNNWNNFLNFKKQLIDNKNYFKEYKSLKTDLAKKYSNDRKRYTQEKNNFIKK